MSNEVTDKVHIAKTERGAGALVLGRHTDPTGVQLRFGRLQSILEPYARYLLKVTHSVLRHSFIHHRSPRLIQI